MIFAVGGSVEPGSPFLDSAVVAAITKDDVTLERFLTEKVGLPHSLFVDSGKQSRLSMFTSALQYRPAALARIIAPIAAISATDDEIAPSQRMAGWSLWTKSWSTTAFIAGSHRFIVDRPDAVLKLVKRFI
jgi:surfactin synthase thioesterase subunit